MNEEEFENSRNDFYMDRQENSVIFSRCEVHKNMVIFKQYEQL